MGRAGRAALAAAAIGLWATGASAQASTAPAAAPEPPDTERRGPYLGLAGSYLIPLSEGALEDRYGPPIDIDPGIGFVVRAGFRFGPLIAAELLYEWIDEFDVQIGGVDAGVQEGDGLFVNAKVYPFTGVFVPIFQPYLHGGLGAQRVELRNQLALAEVELVRFAARVGIGSELYLDEHWLLNLEGSYTSGSGSLADYDLVSIVFGGAYRF